MLNLSAIPNDSLPGRALRWPLRALPEDLAVPILQGPLRGLQWVVGAGSHGCWLGCYEWHVVRSVAKLVTPGMTCLDAGAHAGYYTLLFSILSGPRGRVLAFEPNPDNVRMLQRHLTLNASRNVTVESVALVDTDAPRRFARGAEPTLGRISPDGETTVQCTSLDAWLRRHPGLGPDVMKIDVEGAELDLLWGAQALLGSRRPILFLSTHGRQRREACLALLMDLGYRTSSLGADPTQDGGEILAVAQTAEREMADDRFECGV